MVGEEERQDALEWLERYASTSFSDDGIANAKTVLTMLDEADSLEMNVVGMLTAHRPHDEIRKYILTRQFEDPE